MRSTDISKRDGIAMNESSDLFAKYQCPIMPEPENLDHKILYKNILLIGMSHCSIYEQ